MVVEVLPDGNEKCLCPDGNPPNINGTCNMGEAAVFHP